MTRPHCKPVTVRGVGYPSHAAASRALGISEATFLRAAKIGQDNIDRAGLGRGVEITVDGVAYPSKAAASRALGIPYRKLVRAL